MLHYKLSVFTNALLFLHSTPILETALNASVRDIADAPADVMAQYDAKTTVTKLKMCMDAMKDVRIVYCLFVVSCNIQSPLFWKSDTLLFHCIHSPNLIIHTSSQDPNKVVNMIVENITLAKPLFNNPVGNGVYTFW